MMLCSPFLTLPSKKCILYKYLIVSLDFSHLGFWSGNLFLIAPFPDLCLLVPFYRDFQAKLKCLIHKIGFNSEEFSFHSFRRGGCSFCFRSDVPSELIQLHGDWRADAYKSILPLVWMTRSVLLKR